MATRLQVPYLGEHYTDMLQLEAWIKDRSMPTEAQSLLCSSLMRREATRQAILQRLADKRGISVAALTDQILVGEASPLSQEEFAAVQQQRQDS